MEDAYNQYELEFTRKASVIKDRIKQLPNFKGGMVDLSMMHNIWTRKT